MREILILLVILWFLFLKVSIFFFLKLTLNEVALLKELEKQ